MQDIHTLPLRVPLEEYLIDLLVSSTVDFQIFLGMKGLPYDYLDRFLLVAMLVLREDHLVWQN